MTDDISKVVQYRKKPVVIEAMQLVADPSHEFNDALHAFMTGCDWCSDRDGIQIETLEGMMYASAGDWIIKGVKGEIYPCKPDIFAATYEPADHLESATTPAEVDVPTIARDEPFQRDYIPLGRSGWEIQTKGKGSTYRLCEPDGHRLAIPNEPYLHETLTRMARDVHADYATLARQLAEAKAEANDANMGCIEALDRAEQAESQLAEATRRLGEVRTTFNSCSDMMTPDYANGYREALGHVDLALTKEPTK